MKILPYVCTLTALLLSVGCNRNSDTAAGGSSDNQITSSGSSASADSNRRGEITSAPDNTGKNVRDRSDQSLTPLDQGESQSDLDLTRRVRKAIVSNDQLSADAKNIKIITSGGKVTLRGPVKNEEERKTITSLAQQIAGDKIDDQLEAKATNQ